jgi:hypothetical protein
MEILNDENNQVDLDNINMLSSEPECNSKYDELLEVYNANIDLNELFINKGNQNDKR